MSPEFTWHWAHLRYVQQQLARVTSGEIRRLMIFMPPRHGKSELATVRYPVWRMERDPNLRVIVAAYNKTLAERFSRKSRRIATERMTLNTERSAAEEWETEQGNTYRAVGVGGGVTGQGGHLIVIDDPVKNREEANSETYRNKVWEWYTDDLYTRLEPDASMILIMTRWHMDDLAGRILASDDAGDWTVINLPAEAEENDMLGREVGMALCPERYDLPALTRIKRVLGNSYYALYQQRPVSPEGEIFKRAWFEIVPAAPVEGQRIRYWDKAGTTGGGDHTVGVLMARDDAGLFYVIDVVRGQWAATERERVIRQTAQIDGPNVPIWVEQEPGSGGKESAEATIRNLAGFVVQSERVTGDKVTRAEPMAAQAGGRNIRLVKAQWNAAYLDELTVFPNGTHDDQVDASSGAFSKLAQPSWLLA